MVPGGTSGTFAPDFLYQPKLYTCVVPRDVRFLGPPLLQSDKEIRTNDNLKFFTQRMNSIDVNTLKTIVIFIIIILCLHILIIFEEICFQNVDFVS